MKANKLMIGDWVYDKMLKGYGKIEVLTPFAIQCDIHTDTHNMDFFEPIPLTEEILKANGFVGDGYLTKRIDDELFLEFYIHENRLRKYFCGTDEWQNHAKVKDICFQCNCFYVHELQRALRCCGLWDLADNFKLE